ncbi:MAG TPA: MBL fold metallo-hydrolase [Acidimicrobiia bacterium]|jgi:flavorubredoxin|nr:MBL fold metallo-hydrolase [Acidimicrobiia bacterium]
METRIAEVAPGIHQLTTHVPEMNFSFNQYLVTGDEPLLFHTGPRQMFPLVSDAVSRVMPVDQLRWISFGHVEADECGSMNQWLGAAPQSTVAQSMTGCMVSLNDLADRAPRGLADGEVLDIGGHRMRWIDTPHVPHAWEAGLLYDETTRTLFCGDLFTQTGAYASESTDDIVGPAWEAEEIFHASSLAPSSGATLRRLAELDVEALALMHGPTFSGDCRGALLDLAADFDKRTAAS